MTKVWHVWPVLVLLILTGPLAQAQNRNDAVAERAETLIEAERYSEARDLLIEPARNNNALAQALLARLYERGWGVPQDFTQAELCLYLEVVQNPNDVFLAGDTCQTIARGVGGVANCRGLC